MHSLEHIESFLNGPLRNAWVKAGGYDVYVRRGHHRCGTKVVNCFDLASIHNDGTHENFKTFVGNLKMMLEKKPELRGNITHIYVESVLNKRLASLLPRMGFTPQQDTEPPAFYLKLDVE